MNNKFFELTINEQDNQQLDFTPEELALLYSPSDLQRVNDQQNMEFSEVYDSSITMPLNTVSSNISNSSSKNSKSGPKSNGTTKGSAFTFDGYDDDFTLFRASSSFEYAVEQLGNESSEIYDKRSEEDIEEALKRSEVDLQCLDDDLNHLKEDPGSFENFLSVTNGGSLLDLVDFSYEAIPGITRSLDHIKLGISSNDIKIKVEDDRRVTRSSIDNFQKVMEHHQNNLQDIRGKSLLQQALFHEGSPDQMNKVGSSRTRRSNHRNATSSSSSTVNSTQKTIQKKRSGNSKANNFFTNDELESVQVNQYLYILCFLCYFFNFYLLLLFIYTHICFRVVCECMCFNIFIFYKCLCFYVSVIYIYLCALQDDASLAATYDNAGDDNEPDSARAANSLAAIAKRFVDHYGQPHNWRVLSGQVEEEEFDYNSDDGRELMKALNMMPHEYGKWFSFLMNAIIVNFS
jgi:hypothetical protein